MDATINVDASEVISGGCIRLKRPRSESATGMLTGANLRGRDFEAFRESL